MLSCYACLQVSVEPFILKSQLYSSVKDRTQVDRELEVSFGVLNFRVCLGEISPEGIIGEKNKNRK